MRAEQRLRINLQNRVRDVASDIVKVVMNSFGSEGGDGSFHVVRFVVDDEVEAALQVGGIHRVITCNAGDEDGGSTLLQTARRHLVFHELALGC
jgi:hypothetical protein